MPAAPPRPPPALAPTLAELPVGHEALIARLAGPLPTRRRLAELGFTPGRRVRVERVAPLGDPLQVELRGTRLSLRRDQAACIRLGEPAGAVAADPGAVASAPAALPDDRPWVIAMAGNPNAGKSTLFNALTGLAQEVSNYPGSTVERVSGWLPLEGGRRARLYDLPGIYSLVPASPDERIAVEVLAGLRPDTPSPDLVLAVVDATCLARHLLLVTQLLDTGIPLVVALTMVDEARARGLAVDAAALAQRLGVPVVPVVARTGEGLVALRRALGAARRVVEAPWRGPGLAAHDRLAEAIAERAATAGRPISRAQAAMAAWGLLAEGDFSTDFGLAAIEPLLSQVAQERRAWEERGADPVLDDLMRRYAWIDAALAAEAPARRLARDRMDGVLLHRLAGPAIFAAAMWALFVAVFTLAEPLQGALGALIEALAGTVASALPAGWPRELWSGGIVAGVGGVLSFVPQIALLFALLAVLNESGYLARGAFLLDRLLRGVGLHGRSFVPLLACHGCAIPGIMAARTIPDERERLATMLVAPFMTCSARLPVYTLLIAACFAHLAPWQQGTLLAGLYLGGIAAAAGVAWALRRTVLSGAGASFLIELPPYRLPTAGAVLQTVWRGVWGFVRKAGTIILACSVLLWAALHYPRLDEARRAEIAAGIPAEQAETAIQQAQVAGSLAGRAGRLIEPVLAPIGLDWQVGIGMIGAFAAREVFVSTMGVVYGATAEEGAGDHAPLAERMAAVQRPDGTPMWTTLTATVVLIWFVLAMQCFSTVAVMVRETGGWRWPLVQLAGMNALAYLACLAVWQLGSRW